MPHVVLLGDSIFDNAPYVRAGESVVDAVRRRLPDVCAVTLLARDGSVTNDVVGQLAALPADATHLCISCGGNDALGHLGVLQSGCATICAGLAVLAPLLDAFRADYCSVLEKAVATGLGVTACTIYNAVPGLDAAVKLGLALFNDVIVQEAVAQQVDLLDLRVVVNEAADYSAVSPIEPSEIGAKKITTALADCLVVAGGDSAIRIFPQRWRTSESDQSAINRL